MSTLHQMAKQNFEKQAALMYLHDVSVVLKRELTDEEVERAKALRAEGKCIEEIANALESAQEAEPIEFIDVINRKRCPMNIWGKTTLLLELLMHAGHLPNVSIYGSDPDGPDAGKYFINGEFVGRTEEEVTTAVWRMVACYKANGYLFE